MGLPRTFRDRADPWISAVAGRSDASSGCLAQQDISQPQLRSPTQAVESSEPSADEVPTRESLARRPFDSNELGHGSVRDLRRGQFVVFLLPCFLLPLTLEGRSGSLPFVHRRERTRWLRIRAKYSRERSTCWSSRRCGSSRCTAGASPGDSISARKRNRARRVHHRPNPHTRLRCRVRRATLGTPSKPPGPNQRQRARTELRPCRGEPLVDAVEVVKQFLADLLRAKLTRSNRK